MHLHSSFDGVIQLGLVLQMNEPTTYFRHALPVVQQHGPDATVWTSYIFYESMNFYNAYVLTCGISMLGHTSQQPYFCSACLYRLNGAPTGNRTPNRGLEIPCYIRLTIGAIALSTVDC